MPLALVALGVVFVIAARGWLSHRSSGREEAAEPEEARLLRQALSRPTDRTAQAALGRYYLRAHRPFEAVWMLQRAQAAGSSGAGRAPDPGPAVAIADALEAGGLRARALELLTEAAGLRPGDLALALGRAELQLRLGWPEAAAQSLRPLSGGQRMESKAQASSSSEGRGSPLETAAALLLGRALEAAGDDTAALAQYRRCVAANPGPGEAALRLGRLLVRRGQVTEGRAAIESAHRLLPSSPEPAYALGMSFMPEAAKNPGPAGRWFSEALQVAPEYGPARIALGRLAASHRAWQQAAQQFDQALHSDPRDPEALLGLAEVLAATGHPAEAHQRRGLAYVMQDKLPQALAEFRALKALEPESQTGSILISQTLIQMEQNGAAAREVEAAAARWPRDEALKERLVELYLNSLTHDAAQRLCEEWRRMDPKAAKPLWLLGRMTRNSPGQLSEAIEDYERAAGLAPRDPEILASLSEALFRSGPRHDPGRALDLIRRAIELAPREASYRYQLGLMLQQLERLEPARFQFLRALDRDPHMTAAYTNLIQVSARLREPALVALFAPVVRDQQQAKRIESGLRGAAYRSPADPAGYAALARFLTDRGELKDARAQWEVVLALKPGDTAARRELAWLNRILDAL